MKKTWIISLIIMLSVGIAGIGWDVVSSTVVVNQSDIVFSHKLHVDENEIECEDCHGSIATSDLASDENLPSMDDCGSCHDIEDDEQCGLCHKDPDDPGGYAITERELIFSHKKHMENDAKCRVCHEGIELIAGGDPSVMPEMIVCFECHDSKKEMADCARCHSSDLTLLDVHPIEWKHQHGERASTEAEWCGGCHSRQDFCIACHRGDNILGEIHDLNYIYTHGLDAKGKKADCGQCHDNQAFCVACHEGGYRMPMNHSRLAWDTDHGRYAREDVENCASCHESDDPTCARFGCHDDMDGVRGTNPRIHSADAAQFDYAGPWHDDEGYYCYQCHSTTQYSVDGGFCQYCHD
jgi:hypothetical protein